MLTDVLEMFGGVGQALLAYAWWLGGTALVTAMAWGAGYGWWRHRAAQALRERASVDLVPAVTFDPSLQAIGWFAGQLARVPAAAGALPRRASAVRLRMACDRGHLAYRLEGPQRAASLLRLSAYPSVEVLDSGARQQVPRIRFEGAPPVGADAKAGGAR